MAVAANWQGRWARSLPRIVPPRPDNHCAVDCGRGACRLCCSSRLVALAATTRASWRRTTWPGRISLLYGVALRGKRFQAIFLLVAERIRPPPRDGLRCTGQVTGQYQHETSLTDAEVIHGHDRASPSWRCAFNGASAIAVSTSAPPDTSSVFTITRAHPLHRRPPQNSGRCIPPICALAEPMRCGDVGDAQGVREGPLVLAEAFSVPRLNGEARVPSYRTESEG
jgi:hypothetical protein